MSKETTKIGIVGCGNISKAYLGGCTAFDHIEIIAVADLDVERAKTTAQEYSIPTASDTETLLANPDIEIVINLTIPQAHGTIALAALENGKSVYNEKPLALSRDEGRKMLELGREKGLLVGCAPDTFYGAAHQTARALIDRGDIGEPVGAFASMMGHGAEGWHPNPEFFYKPGGGPMFDMGPYYLTDLVQLLGPVKRVTGATRISFPQRTITSEPLKGQIIDVEIPTHVSGLLDFHCGAVATIITSFDVWASSLPRIEIYGSEASLSVPDPNCFDGPVRIRRSGDEEWQDVPYTHHYTTPGRSIGVADMARALQSGGDLRANGQLAYHVLDLMYSFHDASDAGHHIELQSTCERPAPLGTGEGQDALNA